MQHRKQELHDRLHWDL